MVRKYRESEIKHGRLAMVSALGIIVQEQFHPMHNEVGGLAITHMNHLLHTPGAFLSAIENLSPSVGENPIFEIMSKR